MKKVTITKIDKSQSKIFKDYSKSTQDNKIEIAYNLGVLNSAKSTLLLFESNHTFERARVYNIIAQIEHLIMEEENKINLI
jgi:hypothetical protein